MSDILCAGHAVKEVLTAGECLAALENGVREAEDTVAGSYLLSDGGDGFLEACEKIGGGELREVDCIAPLGDAISAPYLYDESSRTAYIEMAMCSGLRLVEPARRNIMISGTAGLGDLMAAARNAGARRIIVGLGGSATCDGGIGMLWKLADHAGLCQPGACEPRVALDLPDCPTPEISILTEWFAAVELIAMTDVENPLTGPNGSARVFAPQKGANPEQTDQLDGWLGDWCERVQRNAGMSVCDAPGSGAAGGVGFALAVLGAKVVPGAKAMCDLCGLTAALRPGTTVVSTEGRFDATSIQGKAPWTASMEALEKGAKAVIFCGIADESAAETAREHGVTVTEFGRGIPEAERREKSAGALANAVTTHLRGSAAVGI